MSKSQEKEASPQASSTKATNKRPLTTIQEKRNKNSAQRKGKNVSHGTRAGSVLGNGNHTSKAAQRKQPNSANPDSVDVPALSAQKERRSKRLKEGDPDVSHRRPRKNPKIETRNETPVEITGQGTIAKLKSDGFMFVKSSTLPGSDDDAIQKHKDQHPYRITSRRSQQLVQWKQAAKAHFSERLLTNFRNYPKLRKCSWTHELDNGENRRLYGEEFHKVALRDSDAALTNALLNVAMLPPVGYSGCINELVSKALLPHDELELVYISEELLVMLHTGSNAWVDAQE